MLGEAYQAVADASVADEAANLSPSMALHDETTSPSDAEPSEAEAAAARPARRARRAADRA
jgi:hypothetical protein